MSRVGQAAARPARARPKAPIQTPRAPKAARPARRGGVVRLLLRLLGLVLLVLLLGPPVLAAAYRFVPPPITILMVERLFQGQGLDYRWRSLDDISPALAEAALAAEDQRFCQHHGFDFKAMQKALRQNERTEARGGAKLRGGSTISQQTAKNVFLWPGRSYVRKGLEAWDTVLIEAIWGKRRIMEIYLNVAELGPGIYGAQAAADRYFHEDAADLTPAQAARLVAILPSPLKWKPVASGAYMARRSRHIGGAMGAVREGGLADCLQR
jgi:monofunctional biosynthetic peptidoglycan transglycosylase